MKDRYTDRDRKGIEFASMQADMYGMMGVLMLVALVAYGIACLIWGPDQVSAFINQAGVK